MNKYVSIIITALVIITVGIFVYMQWNTAPTAPTTGGTATTTAVIPLPPPQITSVKLGTVLNGEGSVDNPVTSFGKKDNIYAALGLQNALAKTQIAYIRTFNGKYVDSRVSHPTSDGMTTFHFSWILNAGKTRKAGTYGLTFYIDGKKMQSVTYTVK